MALDALFGFSFHGEPRPPFDTLLRDLQESGIPVLSVDVPSGWPVDGGTAEEEQAGGSGSVGGSVGHCLPRTALLRPQGLISLTAPKMCSLGFEGRHYVGGRFVPKRMQREYGLDAVMRLYQGTEMVADVPRV